MMSVKSLCRRATLYCCTLFVYYTRSGIQNNIGYILYHWFNFRCTSFEFSIFLALAGFISWQILVSFITELKWSGAHLGKHHSKFITLSQPTPQSPPAVDVPTTHGPLNRVLEAKRGYVCRRAGWLTGPEELSLLPIILHNDHLHRTLDCRATQALFADHTGQLGENGPLTRSATIRRYLVLIWRLLENFGGEIH